MNLDRYLVINNGTPLGRYVWEFPNGHSGAVVPDTRMVMRWELLDAAETAEIKGLTAEQVEAKLAEVMALPNTEETS